MVEDQITLLDLVIIFKRHKKLYSIVFAVVLVSVFMVVVFSPKRYKYTQAISIAGYVDINKGVTNLVDEKTLIAKIKNIYIPMAVNAYNGRHNDIRPVYLDKNDIDVSATGGGKGEVAANGIVFLSAQNTLKNKGVYEEIFRNVLSRLEHDTGPLYDNFKKNMEEHVVVMLRYLSVGRRMTKGQKMLLDKSSVVHGNKEGMLFTEAQKDLQKTKLALSTLHNSRFDSPFGAYKTKEVSSVALLIVTMFASLFISFIVIVIVDILSKFLKRGK